MHSRTLALTLALVIAAEACCCCTALGGPEPPYAITPSQAAIDEFNARIEEADVAQGEDGFLYFSIYVTEEEATSLLVHEMRDQQQDMPIEQPQIHFRDGRIELYLKLMISDQLPLPAMVALSPGTAGGDFSLTLDEIIVGPLPLPESVIGSLEGMLSDTLSDALARSTERATITDLQIDDGRLVLVFRAEPDEF